MIYSSLEAIDNEMIDCGKCLAKRTSAFRKAKGCVDPVEYDVHPSEMLVFHRCPGNFTRNWVKSYLGVYKTAQNGTMPYEGGYLEQPNKVIEIFNAIDGYRSEKQSKIKKKEGMLKRGR